MSLFCLPCIFVLVSNLYKLFGVWLIGCVGGCVLETVFSGCFVRCLAWSLRSVCFGHT